MTTRTDLEIHIMTVTAQTKGTVFKSALRCVAEFYLLVKEDILKVDRHAEFTRARCMIVGLCKGRVASFNDKELAILFKRHRTSIINMRWKFFDEYDTCEEFKDEWRILSSRLVESIRGKISMPPRLSLYQFAEEKTKKINVVPIGKVVPVVHKVNVN